MSVKGNMETREALVGSIHLLKKIPGYSAYEIAVKHGFKGTEAEWLISISAYGIAVKLGFEGTVEEWIASLKGEKGDIGNVELHGELNALGERIMNVAEPVEDGDAVNKKYADDEIDKKIEENNVSVMQYASETYVPLAYEDISESYIITEGVSIDLPEITQISVHKQGREIRGFVEVDVSANAPVFLFYVNRNYLPYHTVIANAVVFGESGDVIDGNFPVIFKYTLMPNQFICLKTIPEDATKMLLNFSYICKGNEVTV